MRTKSVECFATDPKSRGLRVELTPQESLVLPHEHFMYSKLCAGTEFDTLTLCFMTHEVVLTGYGLRRVEGAMQVRDLSWVAARTVRYKSQGVEKGFISSITVRQTDEDKGDANSRKN